MRPRSSRIAHCSNTTAANVYPTASGKHRTPAGKIGSACSESFSVPRQRSSDCTDRLIFPQSPRNGSTLPLSAPGCFPTIEVEAQHGSIMISGKKLGYEVVNIYSRKKDELTWKLIANRIIKNEEICHPSET